MPVEYSTRAVADIRNIADYYAGSEAAATGERVAARFREVVARIARLPGSGRPVIERPGVRAVPLLRYPYIIFYAVSGDAVRILHIRHTAQRAWTGA
jgi:toxin ParE1/3/4